MARLMAKDVREKLMHASVPIALIHIIEILCEMSETQRQQIYQLANIVNKLIDINAETQAAAHNIVEAIKAKDDQDDDLTPTH